MNKPKGFVHRLSRDYTGTFLPQGDVSGQTIFAARRDVRALKKHSSYCYICGLRFGTACAFLSLAKIAA